MTLLHDALLFLLVAIIAVPLSKRLGFGSVLGYLIAGIAIGPSVFKLVTDVDDILHFGELGVVFLLFIIGLELQPARFWVMRRLVFGLGLTQVMVTGALLAAIAAVAGLPTNTAIVAGYALALSSTAFVLQMLNEQKELSTRYGRASFSILLFQDLAVIPMITLMPLLASGNDIGADPVAIGLALLAILALILGGRYLLRPVLRMVAASAIPEVLTATALLVVIGSAVLMEQVGLSMGLGAFIAGMLLADSEYRHQLESDIEPFKGLLLGLFFIAVGMSVDLSLIVTRPADVFGLLAVLIFVKAVVLFACGRVFAVGRENAFSLAAILAQGGEFAFVLFTQAVSLDVMPAATADLLVVVVTLSMAATPLLYLANRWRNRRVSALIAPPAHDEIQGEENEIIIASFGRFGQIIGRILNSKRIPFTALESNIEQVEVVRRFGNKVYFGDARKIELLRAAGADTAKYFVLAISDVEGSIATARIVRQHFPHLRILARARNRVHAHQLMDLGIDAPVRDTLHSSLQLTRDLLEDLGFDPDDARHVVDTFREHDERTLRRQHSMPHDEASLIQTAREAATELESLLRADRSTKASKEGAAGS